MKSEIELNYTRYKESSESNEKIIKKLLRDILKNSPREWVIEECKRLKIIKYDYVKERFEVISEESK